ncbi:hypothetical protein ABZW11_21360 [Nonomuraea sp. NPDC004580]|uniref:aromatic-ring hydroxylase C-terminal domain-containing protein n=1 Tax=Nonomuraea sp. NPDC004580 TaxID=3154552 RepID=UPI0033B61480
MAPYCWSSRRSLVTARANSTRIGTARGLGPGGAVLVRPDRFVAWCGTGLEAGGALTRALRCQ